MGFIEKRSGKYRARYRDVSGRQRSKTFTLKADAERFIREEEVALERGSWIDPRAADMTLGEWCERFMSLARRLADTTQQTYRRDLGRYVLPKFGSYRLGRLRAEEIEEWLLDEIDSGLAPSSVHRHYRTLHRVLEVAVKHKRLAVNPCAGVQPPSVPRRRMVILDWPQVFELADSLPDRYRVLVFLAVDSGMRWSELVGLRRSRVDLRACKIEVVEQLIRLDSGGWVWHPPKSEAEVRTIAISPFTARMLAEHMEQFSAPGADGLVFVNQAGNPLIASSFHTHYFKPALRRAVLACRFHDLRHTSVALAIRAGAHAKTIQVRMGHASITVTLDRYGHLFPELDEAIALAFDKALTAADTARRGGRVSEVA
jgi:integrase